MKTSEQIDKIAGALSVAQMEIKNPEKDTQAEGDKGNYKTAPISAFFDAVKAPFGKNGIAYFQDLKIDEERKRVSCNTRLMHASGQWLEPDEPIVLHYQNATPEDRGMTIYLARKHSFQSVTGMAAANEIEESGSKPRRDYTTQYATGEERKTAKQQVLDALNLVKDAGGNLNDLNEAWEKHKETVDKLALEDPQYISDIIRLKRDIEDNLEGKI